MSESSETETLAKLRRCLQCAACTGSCPTARVIDGYNPREMILRHILYGREDGDARAELIWCCATCHTCEERCPHDIGVGDLLIEIMNRQAARGFLPQALRQTVANLAATGRAIPATGRTTRLREKLGLRPLQDCNTEKIGKILRQYGIDDLPEAKCE